MELKIEYIPLDEIQPYENNAKEHPKEQIEQIKESIRQFGMDDPIGIWGENNTIVEGHGRLLACAELDMETVPVVRLDHLTDEERRAYTLAHNQLTMNSGFDKDVLAIELDDIKEIDMSDFGFDIKPITDDDEEEEHLFEDVEKLESHYGVPYQGNKSRIADIIVKILPSGERLVDLFGGGGGDNPLCVVKWQMEVILV